VQPDFTISHTSPCAKSWGHLMAASLSSCDTQACLSSKIRLISAWVDFGIVISGIHKHPLVFYQVCHSCVVSCFSPFVSIHKQTSYDWPYIKDPEIKRGDSLQP